MIIARDHVESLPQVCKYKPDSVEACKRRLGRMVLAFNLVTAVLTLAPVILFAYVFNLI